MAQCHTNSLRSYRKNSRNSHPPLNLFSKQMIKKILINKQGKKFYIRDANKDFHTQFGFIKAKDLKKKDGSLLKTNKGKEFYIFSAFFSDKYDKLKREAQIITRKDIGEIIALTGINKNSKVLDAGAGSGALSCALANICKEVIAYDNRNPALRIIKDNKELLGLKNLKIKKKDIYEGIAEKNLDLITLDLPEPWRVLKHAEVLKHGGFLVCYLPSMTQVIKLVEEIDKNDNFVYLKTTELIQRDWLIGGRIARPETQMLGHTGFLIFIRRV